ncbi:adenylate/guanylate cyclase domain-containing protein [Mesorhizobium sp. NZP2077]|uniref:adenylate/guanylate cyclase domain-containing protein n=1 Tax=Mesorhizobium sp. NZP2077 TaxID=2483404 RepID=UPI001556AF16|nr:adenylate/guanylate cyclase domain-containing protein [Mesorhizobium sp. NZP2077]QKC82565.1 adenylate/guanylate cyclase domain-containing protein [Mesorhizobium sp. NZP2077]QKD16060.1 adenylate/guanylate cyclase domain-containing protein [Mesorhizobium sp. NZP2077]
MHRLPKEVENWTYNLFYNERSIAYVKIDAQLCIAGKGGNVKHYGLSSLRIGKPVTAQLEFMEGLLPCPELPYHMPMVELPSGRVADLHLFADDDCVWLLFLDVTAERDNKQRLQQKAYEMTLLQERERQLNEKLQSMNEALRESQEGLQREYQRAETLLLNILPASIAERLKSDEQIADNHAEVSVLFADIVGFTERARSVGAVTTLAILNYFFKAADRLSDQYGCEKIKTIGDCVMVVAGMPAARSDHAEALARYALELREAVRHERFAGERLRLRIGINSGPIVAGVIGKKRFAYDLWGETVNLAARIQTSAEPDEIRISDATRRLLGPNFACDPLAETELRGTGRVRMWRLPA